MPRIKEPSERLGRVEGNPLLRGRIEVNIVAIFVPFLLNTYFKYFHHSCVVFGKTCHSLCHSGVFQLRSLVGTIGRPPQIT